MKVYKPCDSCKTLPIPGIIELKDREGHSVSVECQCLKEYNNYKQLYDCVTTGGFPIKFAEYDISTYIGDKSLNELETIKKIANNMHTFIEKGMQLYIYGQAKTQKTSMASYLAKQALLSGNRFRYITFQTIIEEKKKIEFHKEVEIDNFSDLETVPLLIIDNAFELDGLYIKKSENYSKTVINNLLNKRLSNGLSQIYVSKIRKDSIDPKLGDISKKYLNDECIELQFQDVVPSEIRNKYIQELLKGGILG